MQQKSKQRFFRISVKLDSGVTRIVPVKASSREVAESRALKKCSEGAEIVRAS